MKYMEVNKIGKKLNFFDLKSKKKFTTDKFTLTTRGPRKTRFAVAKAPSGIRSFRIVAKDFKK